MASEEDVAVAEEGSVDVAEEEGLVDAAGEEDLVDVAEEEDLDAVAEDPAEEVSEEEGNKCYICRYSLRRYFITN